MASPAVHLCRASSKQEIRDQSSNMASDFVLKIKLSIFGILWSHSHKFFGEINNWRGNLSGILADSKSLYMAIGDNSGFPHTCIIDKLDYDEPEFLKDTLTRFAPLWVKQLVTVWIVERIFQQADNLSWRFASTYVFGLDCGMFWVEYSTYSPKFNRKDKVCILCGNNSVYLSLPICRCPLVSVRECLNGTYLCFALPH